MDRSMNKIPDRQLRTYKSCQGGPKSKIGAERSFRSGTISISFPNVITFM